MLSACEILARLSDPDPHKRIIVTPIVRMQDQLGPNSLDVRLGTEFLVVERSEHTHFDMIDCGTGEDPSRRTRRIRRTAPDAAFVLHPREFALGSTLEFIRIPVDLVGRLDGRSTWARKGLQVHSTASIVHAGSEGVITFELQNVGDLPFTLYPGTRIAQLTFYALGEPAVGTYRGWSNAKYAGYARAQESRYQLEPEIVVIRELCEERRLAEGRDCGRG